MIIIVLDILQALADFIGAIITFLQPIVTPIGKFMVLWINFVLNFFPDDNWLIYIIVFAIFIISGVIVNCYWPGDEPLEEETEVILEEEKTEEKLDEEKREEEQESDNTNL